MSEEKKQAVHGLLAEVGDLVKGSSQQVYDSLRSEMVNREVNDRVSLLDKAIQQRFKLMGDLKKIDRPDNESFDADGKVVSASYTKQRLEEIRKAREPIQKLESAIEKALSENDFGKLKELVK